MAARLEWKGFRLMMGEFEMAQVHFDGSKWSILLPSVLRWCESESTFYEDKADCYQGCESEVRRLLKEAGCEVEP